MRRKNKTRCPKTDALGYDILSYRFNGIKIEEIYIEIKTITNKHQTFLL